MTQSNAQQGLNPQSYLQKSEKLIDDVTKPMQSATGSPDIVRPLLQLANKLAFTTAILALSGLSYSSEVILRWRFGERYLRLGPVVISILCIYMAGQLFGDARIMLTFMQVFIVLVLIHAVEIEIRNRRGVRWHSKAPGLSHLLPVFARIPILRSEGLLLTMCDPLTAIAIGAVLLSVSKTLGGFFIAGGFALWAKQLLEFKMYRDRLLDIIDGKIEEEMFADALSGKAPPKETFGFVIPGASKFTDKERSMLIADREQLHPELMALLDESKNDTSDIVSDQAEPNIPADDNAAAVTDDTTP